MILLMSALFSVLFMGCEETIELLEQCEDGNTEACFKEAQTVLGRARPNYSRARKLLVQACMPRYRKDKGPPKENFPAACAQLANLVKDAKGGPRDMPRATELYEIACKAGFAESCVELGLAVYAPERGDEVLAEPERSVELFFTACNKVDPQAESKAHPLARACDALGLAYQEGKGVEDGKADPARAQEMYLKACDAKYAPGCVHAGQLIADRKIKGQVPEAAELFDRACELDARHGCFELAQLHEKKRWPDATPEQAEIYYRRTCKMDPTRGCFEAAVLMEKGLVETREGEIESLYNLACEHGHATACTRRRVQ